MFLNCNLEDGEFLHQKARKKFWAPGEDRTHQPSDSSLDALATKLQEALWQAGSEFNYKYTSCILIQQQTLLGQGSAIYWVTSLSCVWVKIELSNPKNVIFLQTFTIFLQFFVAFLMTGVGNQAPALGNDTHPVCTIKYLKVLFTCLCASKMIFFRKAIYSI